MPNALPTIRVEVFRARVLRSGAALKLRRRELKLLVALALQLTPHDVIGERLWPDVAREHAHSAMRTTMHRLRGHLHDTAAIVHESGYSLAEHVRVDVREAEHALQTLLGIDRSDDFVRERSAELFGVVNFHLPAIYDSWPWFTVEKPRLLELRRTVGLLLFHTNMETAKFAEAAQVAERLLHFDSFDEPVIALLAHALQKDGKHMEARRRVHQHAELFARETERKLSAEILRLVEDSD